MKISIICPTRKRTKDVTRLLHSLYTTAHDLSNIEIIFVIDDDDVESDKYLSKVVQKASLNVKKVVVERNKFIFSDLANQALPYCDGELFLAIGDDGVFKTQNWDLEVQKAFLEVEDRILLLHFNDLSSHCHDLAGHLVLHKNWTETVGYFSPPWFNGDWGDWWLTHISDGIGRRKYRKDLIIEHLNIQFGKAYPDETYYEHKQRREKLGSPAKNPKHPMNVYDSTKKKNIQDLQDFIKNFKKDV